ncbi:MAG: hypothetical protein M3O30_11955 [Planctomycetota bacterium]|nr:hypothetical protein [Planctomycetota bacterium]
MNANDLANLLAVVVAIGLAAAVLATIFALTTYNRLTKLLGEVKRRQAELAAVRLRSGQVKLRGGSGGAASQIANRHEQRIVGRASRKSGFSVLASHSWPDNKAVNITGSALQTDVGAADQELAARQALLQAIQVYNTARVEWPTLLAVWAMREIFPHWRTDLKGQQNWKQRRQPPNRSRRFHGK